MFSSSTKRGLGALAGAFFCAQAWAAPANDRWSDRLIISQLPYAITAADIGTANANSEDPAAPCHPDAIRTGNTTWYSYTTGADTEYLNLDTLGSNYDSVLSVWTGAPGSFELVGGGCNDNGNLDGSTNTARIAGVRLMPDTEYSILVSRITQGTGSYMLKLGVDEAPVYRVTTATDRAGILCNAGDCSLREAISNAGNAPGAVLIPAGIYKIEIPGTGEDNNASGDFDLRASMGLYGAGMNDTIVDGNALDRVFHLDPSGAGVTQGRMTAHFSDLTIRGGKGSSGAGVFSNSGGSFLAVSRAAVRDNESSGNGGGISIGMRTYLRETLVRDNVASGFGGGLSLNSTAANVNIDIVASAIVGNRANGGGTGSTGGGLNSSQLVRISNSTIQGNQANHSGGGLNIDGSNAELGLYSSTVTHNRSDADGSAAGSGGGLRFNGGKTSSVRNTLLAYNVDPTNAGAPIFGPDCSKNNSTTLGFTYSLVADTRGRCSYTGDTNLLDTDPAFDGQLGDHGGPTPTLLPLADSPLVDAGDPNGCKDASSREPAFDQRGSGHPRSVDSSAAGTARCDIGAVEYAAPAVEPVVGAPALLAADDSGLSSNDNITRTVSPRFDGSCRGEVELRLLVDGVNETVSAVCAAGAYQLAVAAPLADGVYQIAAQAREGEVWTEPTAAVAVTIDNRSPVVSFTEAPPPGITGDEAQFRIGVDEAVPALCSLDGQTPVACRNPHKLFLLDPGMHRFVAEATDLAGNVGSAEYVFERVELSPLEAPFLDAVSDSGRSDSDSVTNADPLRIIGACRNGDLVKVYDIDEYMAASGICGGSAFAIDVAGAREGLRVIAVSATRAGLETSRSPGAFVLVDRTAPAAPTIVPPAVVGNPQFALSGSAEANADVVVSAGSTLFCSARAESDGRWACSGDIGAETALSAVATDAAGNAGMASAPVHIDLLTAPDTPFLDPGSDSGRSASDGVTNAEPFRVTGTCRDGDVVKVYDVDEYTGAAGTCSGGAFAIDVGGASEGLRVIGVSATRAGLESARSPGAFVLIDRTSPASPAIVLPANIDRPDFVASGSAEAGADVTVSAGAQAFCSTRAGTDGLWSCAGNLGQERSLSATATDVAGNVSASSAAVVVDWDQVFRDGFDD